MKSSKSVSSCQQTMKLLGDFWTLRIIDALRIGERRFCELQRSLDNVNPATLTKRLKTLEETGIVQRSEETVDRISVTYSLTELGKEALSVIRAMDHFQAKAAVR